MRRYFVATTGEKISVRDYTPADRRRSRKFLYSVDDSGEETLIVGRQGQHRYLLEQFIEVHGPFWPNLRGAGDLVRGNVAFWRSEGFNIETPDELKPRILELLQEEVPS